MTALGAFCPSSAPHHARPTNNGWRPGAASVLAACSALVAWLAGTTPALAAGPAVQASAPVTSTSTIYAWHPATVDSQAYLPVLGDHGTDLDCDDGIKVQNLGSEPAKAAVVLWGETGQCPPQCAGPIKVECSGLLMPGGTWTFTANQLAAHARSGWIASFTARRFSDAIPEWPGDDDVVADYLCETLFFGVVGDCDDFRRFKRAYDLGLSFAGVPQDKASGGPIAVWATRDCPARAKPITSRAAYAGMRGGDVGGFYDAERTYRYAIAAGAPSLADPAPRGLHVQNAGIECITVRVLANTDCGQSGVCQEFTLAPGERQTVPNTACDLERGGWLEASGPVAAVLDDWGAGSIATLPLESEQRWSYTTGNVAERQAGGKELSAPLLYRNYQGWSTGLVIQNLSRETEAAVRVLIVDRSGDVLTSYQPPRICPLGNVYIAPGTIADMPSNWVGMARVVSVDWWLPGAGVPDPPRLLGWAIATTTTGGGDALSYPLLVRERFEDWPPPAEQVGVVAIPSIQKAAKDGDLTTELVIANTVQLPGFTDFAIYLYDQNGLLDYICQRLNEKQVEYIKFQTWGYVNSGFLGSAVVSAMFWEHDVFDGGAWVRNDLGLEAVTAARPARKEEPFPPQPQPSAGNEPSWAAAGMPLTLVTGHAFARGLTGLPQCPAVGGGPRPTPPRLGWTPTPEGALAPTASPTTATTPTLPGPHPARVHLPLLWTYREASDPTPTPPATPPGFTGAEAEGEGSPYRPPSPQVHVPVLAVTNDTTPCDSQVHVMNVDAQPLVALMVVWNVQQDCDANCPSAVVCSGLIQPGTRWTFTPASGRSAALFSLRAGTLADIGVPGQNGRTIADAVCASLNAAVRTCAGVDVYTTFKRAYDAGTAYQGIPLDKARGGALAVQVDRQCPGSDTQTSPVTSSYEGVAASALGAADSEDGRHWYSLPLIYGSRSRLASTVYIQNASSTCATVTLYGKAQDDCLRMNVCGAFPLSPGQMRSVPAIDCVGENWMGAFFVASDQPLALAVDNAGRDTLSTYNGQPLAVLDPTTGSVASAGSAVLFAPLMYSEYQGWDMGVQVQNTARDRNAKVKAYFLDRSGDVITTLVDWVCPLGSQTFYLPVVHDLPGHWVGSVRIESQLWWAPSSSTDLPPRVTAVASLLKYADRFREHTVATAAYNLLPEAEAYDWKAGRGAGGLESGVGLIALPYLSTSYALGARTEVAVTNVVPQPGFTAFTLALFDANGHVGDVCLHLHEKQAAYFDLSRWGYLTPAFTGSALVSATYWNHDILFAGDQFVRRVVGLTAAVAGRHGAALGEDVPGDELSISLGIPLRGEAAAGLLPLLAGVGCRIAAHEDIPWARAAEVGARGGELLVPALRSGPGTSPCAAEITVQNLGRAGPGEGSEAKVLLVAWGAASCPANCTPAIGVLCTGLLGPGGSWTLSTAALPASAVAGSLFSLAPATADRLCPLLAGATGGAETDCSRLRSFVVAYREADGGSFEGVGLSGQHGPAIAAEVLRDCPAMASSGVATTASYRASNRGEAEWGDTQQGHYRYDLAQLGTVSRAGESVITVQNVGNQCATVELTVSGAGGGLTEAEVCASASVPPDGTARLTLERCRQGGRRLLGAGRLHSSQPLAAVVDTAAPFTLSSYSGQPSLSGADSVLFGPLTYSEYQDWDIAVHLQNAHLSRAGLVKISFLDRSGDRVDTLLDWIGAGGSTVVNLANVTDLPGNWVGSVRVESLDYPDDAGGRLPSVPVRGVVRAVRGGDRADIGVPAAAMTYRLLSSGYAVESLWPLGPTGGRLTADGGLIALPHLFRQPLETPGGSEIAIANLVPVPGFTDFAVYLFDQNGPIDDLCQRLYSQQVEYIDLATWGYVPESFRGSAVISALYWDHELRNAEGMPIRNLVGLGAVLIQRSGARLGKDVPGDELAVSEAQPLPSHDRLALDLPSALCPGAGANPAPTPTSAVAADDRRMP